MGAEESKGLNYGLMGPSAVVANMNRQAQAARPWSLLHMCSVDQWKSGHAGVQGGDTSRHKHSTEYSILKAAGFSETTMSCNGIVFKDCSPTFCISRQGIININKSHSVFSFRRRNKFTKMAEHFEYNHIPAQLSSIQNFHVKSVLCYHESTVILHLVRNMMTQFGVIDLETNKFLGVFGKQNVEFINDALRGEISPDGNLCMVKIPSIKSATNSSFVFQLFCIKKRELLSEVTLPFHHSLFAFDPRFGSSRIAATSFIKGEDNSMSLVQLDSWSVIKTNPRVDDMHSSLNPHLKDIFFAKDGLLIFAVMVSGGSGCCCREKRARRMQPVDVCVYIFNADTTQTLHCIQYNRYICSVHSCPVNYLPIFSNCGSRMAIVLNDKETQYDHLQIYKLPTSGSLQNRCRMRILQQFQSPEIIQRLPLPTRLIQYLQFQPEFA